MARSPGARGAVSMADVAARAGVSTATVSRSLRGSAVSSRTRERVLKAAAELQYVPSPAASRLASGRTRSVAVVVPFATRWFFAEVLAGAERVLREASFDLLLYNIGDSASRAQFFETLPIRRRVDAVLVVSSVLTGAEQQALTALDVPLVSIGCRIPGAPSVIIEDDLAAATATRHLLGLGHRNVAMLSGSTGDPVGAVTTTQRQAGFRMALAEAGVEELRILEEAWGITGGERAMERLLGESPLPTAVFTESDEMAFGALRMLRRAGIPVPGRMSVVGVDDHEFAAAVDLTTVAQPVTAQGRAAASAILEMLTADRRPRSTILPTRLVVRGSTAPPGE